MKSNIYVSSIAFSNSSIKDIINICEENKFNLEFSSGLPYKEDMDLIYLNSKLKRMVHNYFPAPKTPFVINLASEDKLIRQKSIDHCKKCIALTKKSEAPFFAVHAGFCIDPDPLELGKIIDVKSNYNKEVNKYFFLESIRDILSFAEDFQVKILIENNVIAPFNYENQGNFLLCTSYDEIKWFFETIDNKNIGLLLDTAHLKVSCKTLGLNLNKEFEKIKPYIKAFHHSDNDGTVDNNMKLTLDYWFLEYIEEFKEYIHVLEVKDLKELEIIEQLKFIEVNE